MKQIQSVLKATSPDLHASAVIPKPLSYMNALLDRPMAIEEITQRQQGTIGIFFFFLNEAR